MSDPLRVVLILPAGRVGVAFLDRLRQRGHRLDLVSGADHAIAHWRNAHADIILRPSNLETVRVLRHRLKHTSLADRPLVAGYFDGKPERLREALASGLDDYVSLSMDSADIDARLDAIEQRCRIRDAWRAAEQHRARGAACLALIDRSLSCLLWSVETQVPAAIEAVLADLGPTIEVDRCYVFELDETTQLMSSTFEWLAAGFWSQREHFQKIDLVGFPWLYQRLVWLPPIVIPGLDALPADAVAERIVLEAQEIRSWIVAPMIVAGHCTGFLGADTIRVVRDWTHSDVHTLRAMPALIGNALAHGRRGNS